MNSIPTLDTIPVTNIGFKQFKRLFHGNVNGITSKSINHRDNSNVSLISVSNRYGVIFYATEDCGLGWCRTRKAAISLTNYDDQLSYDTISFKSDSKVRYIHTSDVSGILSVIFMSGKSLDCYIIEDILNNRLEKKVSFDFAADPIIFVDSRTTKDPTSLTMLLVRTKSHDLHIINLRTLQKTETGINSCCCCIIDQKVIYLKDKNIKIYDVSNGNNVCLFKLHSSLSSSRIEQILPIPLENETFALIFIPKIDPTNPDWQDVSSRDLFILTIQNSIPIWNSFQDPTCPQLMTYSSPPSLFYYLAFINYLNNGSIVSLISSSHSTDIPIIGKYSNDHYKLWDVQNEELLATMPVSTDFINPESSTDQDIDDEFDTFPMGISVDYTNNIPVPSPTGDPGDPPLPAAPIIWIINTKGWLIAYQLINFDTFCTIMKPDISTIQKGISPTETPLIVVKSSPVPSPKPYINIPESCINMVSSFQDEIDKFISNDIIQSKMNDIQAHIISFMDKVNLDQLTIQNNNISSSLSTMTKRLSDLISDLLFVSDIKSNIASKFKTGHSFSASMFQRQLCTYQKLFHQIDDMIPDIKEKLSVISIIMGKEPDPDIKKSSNSMHPLLLDKVPNLIKIATAVDNIRSICNNLSNDLDSLEKIVKSKKVKKFSYGLNDIDLLVTSKESKMSSSWNQLLCHAKIPLKKSNQVDSSMYTDWIVSKVHRIQIKSIAVTIPITRKPQSPISIKPSTPILPDKTKQDISSLSIKLVSSPTKPVIPIIESPITVNIPIDIDKKDDTSVYEQLDSMSTCSIDSDQAPKTSPFQAPIETTQPTNSDIKPLFSFTSQSVDQFSFEQIGRPSQPSFGQSSFGQSSFPSTTLSFGGNQNIFGSSASSTGGFAALASNTSGTENSSSQYKAPSFTQFRG